MLVELWVIMPKSGWPVWANFRQWMIVYFEGSVKITEVALLFPIAPVMYWFDKNCLGYILGDFIASSSRHL
jgi:hypothetical protein